MKATLEVFLQMTTWFLSSHYKMWANEKQFWGIRQSEFGLVKKIVTPTGIVSPNLMGSKKKV